MTQWLVWPLLPCFWQEDHDERCTVPTTICYWSFTEKVVNLSLAVRASLTELSQNLQPSSSSSSFLSLRLFFLFLFCLLLFLFSSSTFFFFLLIFRRLYWSGKQESLSVTLNCIRSVSVDNYFSSRKASLQWFYLNQYINYLPSYNSVWWEGNSETVWWWIKLYDYGRYIYIWNDISVYRWREAIYLCNIGGKFNKYVRGGNGTI